LWDPSIASERGRMARLCRNSLFLPQRTACSREPVNKTGRYGSHGNDGEGATHPEAVDPGFVARLASAGARRPRQPDFFTAASSTAKGCSQTTWRSPPNRGYPCVWPTCRLRSWRLRAIKGRVWAR
jgi:hypothetical protein